MCVYTNAGGQSPKSYLWQPVIASPLIQQTKMEEVVKVSTCSGKRGIITITEHKEAVALVIKMSAHTASKHDSLRARYRSLRSPETP